MHNNQNGSQILRIGSVAKLSFVFLATTMIGCTDDSRPLSDSNHTHYHVHQKDLAHDHTHPDFTSGGHSHPHVHSRDESAPAK